MMSIVNENMGAIQMEVIAQASCLTLTSHQVAWQEVEIRCIQLRVKGLRIRIKVPCHLIKSLQFNHPHDAA